jgi:hypothetical protein
MQKSYVNQENWRCFVGCQGKQMSEPPVMGYGFFRAGELRSEFNVRGGPRLHYLEIGEMLRIVASMVHLANPQVLEPRFGNIKAAVPLQTLSDVDTALARCCVDDQAKARKRYTSRLAPNRNTIL